MLPYTGSWNNPEIVLSLNPFPNKPFPKWQILDSSKLKEFADYNFKFQINDGKFSKEVENTVGKGEIAHHEQFLLFPQCFQKACTPDTWKQGLAWERINGQPNK